MRCSLAVFALLVFFALDALAQSAETNSIALREMQREVAPIMSSARTKGLEMVAMDDQNPSPTEVARFQDLFQSLLSDTAALKQVFDRNHYLFPCERHAELCRGTLQLEKLALLSVEQPEILERPATDFESEIKMIMIYPFMLDEAITKELTFQYRTTGPERARPAPPGTIDDKELEQILAAGERLCFSDLSGRREVSQVERVIEDGTPSEQSYVNVDDYDGIALALEEAYSDQPNEIRKCMSEKVLPRLLDRLIESSLRD